MANMFQNQDMDQQINNQSKIAVNEKKMSIEINNEEEKVNEINNNDQQKVDETSQKLQEKEIQSVQIQQNSEMRKKSDDLKICEEVQMDKMGDEGQYQIHEDKSQQKENQQKKDEVKKSSESEILRKKSEELKICEEIQMEKMTEEGQGHIVSEVKQAQKSSQNSKKNSVQKKDVKSQENKKEDEQIQKQKKSEEIKMSEEIQKEKMMEEGQAQQKVQQQNQDEKCQSSEAQKRKASEDKKQDKNQQKQQQQVLDKKQQQQVKQQQVQKQQEISQDQVQTLYALGSAECDQFYIGEEDENGDPIMHQKRPFQINYFSDRNILIHKIICGGLHTVALTTYGDVYTWGCNDSGALGRITNSSEEEDKLNPDGQCSLPGRVQFPGDYKFDLISAGDSHTCCANTQHNILFQWGNFRDNKGEMFKTKNLPERIGEKELKNKQLTKVVSGGNHLFILASETLFAWGDPDTCVLGRKPTDRHRKEQVNRIESIQKQVKDVWTGGYHGFLKKERKRKNIETGQQELVNLYYSWGLNKNGQLGIDSEEDMSVLQQEIVAFRGKNMVQFNGGEHHSMAIDDQGQLYVWGKNDEGQLGLGESLDDLIDLGVYTQEEIDKIKDESEKKRKYTEVRKPVKLEIMNKDEEELQVKEIHCGTNFSYAFTTNEDYQLYSWGMGLNFVLGSRGETTRYKPWNLFQDKVLNDEQVQQLALSSQHVNYITSESPIPPPLNKEAIKNVDFTDPRKIEEEKEKERLKEEEKLQKSKIREQKKQEREEKQQQLKEEREERGRSKIKESKKMEEEEKNKSKIFKKQQEQQQQKQKQSSRSKSSKQVNKKQVKQDQSRSKSKGKVAAVSSKKSTAGPQKRKIKDSLEGKQTAKGLKGVKKSKK
ncbi:Regulator of chromosome condensation 1/beta-lactamase-inhibitor protein II [Pseudocohnilembus persalinus]|uniref:Regulator of chromosome condensation 1/beta-lactamase-inhibitor protein II n=1 Tax=Pseudocohnilembus persalinus TaxID=266149 RepID=A0A0V0QHH6_PSEPJ|nr:Regulator of chromosome condensation 1/beta-lactamase-inhibitor protein II [Pseudocohnilembus persalinus]|eukprot:KRX01636.1 Regulator of chromosome condensation 1/beta-lactamase-inhibitor protein II [Pseudocohnilembus persalinus]